MNIDETMLEVRKAYRLVHAFQRLALDGIRYVGDQLGFDYVGGYPKLSDVTPRLGKGGLDYWAWDWLNMVLYEFHFVRKVSGGKEMKMSVLLISDSGFFELDDRSKAEPQGADLVRAERSQTLLGFVFSSDGWTEPKFMATYAGMKAFIESGGDMTNEYKSKGMVARCVPFARLASESSASALVDELVAFANQHGIAVKRRVSPLTHV